MTILRNDHVSIDLISRIQSDALREAAEIAALYTDADFDCAAKLILDAILARAKELDQ